jgi:tetratricopeptide (TPR) repeat protein
MKKTDPKTKSSPSFREISEKLFESFFLPWAVVLIIAHLLTVYLLPQYMWGVHFYHFFPFWIGWISTLIMIIVMIPGIGERLFAGCEALALKVKKPFDRLNPNLLFLVGSFLSLPLFWIFRNRLHLLGDGYFRIQDLPEGRLHPQEWLDGFIHLMVFRTATKLTASWTPEFTYAAISVICGGIFVFISLKLASFLGKNGFQKVVIFFFLITLGSVQLFFGYVESYTILQVMLLAYIWFSVRCLAGKSGIYLALLTLVISIGLHITSLMYVPSFIYLLAKRRTFQAPSGSEATSSGGKQKGRSGGKTELKKTLSNAFVFAALFLASSFAIFWVYFSAARLEKSGKGMFFVPLSGTVTYRFSMFSLAHLSEYINQLLLLSPWGVSFIFFFLCLRIRHKSFRTGGKLEDMMINFLYLSSLAGLVYLFVINFTLGSADWDLRCSPAPFLGILGALLFVRWGEKVSAAGRSTSAENQTRKIPAGKGKKFWHKHTVQAWGVIFICFGLFHTIPWVWINASKSKSVERYMLIQEYDPHPVDATNYNLYKIARILNLAEVSNAEEILYQSATERNPYDTLSYFNLAAFYHRKESYDKALVVVDSLLKIDPDYAKANWMKGNIEIKREEFDKAIPFLEKALPYLSNDAGFLFDLGTAYYKTGHFEQAELCAEEIIGLDPKDVSGFHLMGLIYVTSGDLDNAQKAWEEVLTINPYDSTAITNLQTLAEQKKMQGKKTNKP